MDSTIDEKLLRQLDKEITSQLKDLETGVLRRANKITGKNDKLLSFHAQIGRHNTILVDSIRTQFKDPDDFIARWIDGLFSRVSEIEDEQRMKYGRQYKNKPEHTLLRFLKDPIIQKYILLFLERNFYRNFLERTRSKPTDNLWRLWFGKNDLVWGLIIAPAFRNGEWTNDVSEIRRVRYDYWTIGHLMEEGLIDPDSDEPLKFATLRDFYIFYRSILKRVSNSLYEKHICNRYVEYLKNSKDVFKEPFLIPELRYAGLSRKHVHRLDYTVMNPHVMKRTGFELSPASTHFSISGITKTTQIQLNSKLSLKWEKEMDKRNDYFKTFDIPIITFTDKKLKNMDNCFEIIASCLLERPPISVTLSDILNKVNSYMI